MIKLKPLKYDDLYNVQTGDYFPDVIDNVSIHIECFPPLYNTVFNYDKPAPLDTNAESLMKDKYVFDIKLPYYSRVRDSFKEWAKQGHIFTFKLNYKPLSNLQFGRLIHVRRETLCRDDSYPIPGNRYSKYVPNLWEVDVIKLELESLSNLEACELIEEKNL